jgi:hypothetical protein
MIIARIAACASAVILSTAVASAKTTSVPSGQLVSVMLMKDIGSRNSVEGDPVPVKTIEDLYVRGNLVLPKGSPGYGVITHVGRSGMFHRGGEFAFEIRRLVAPDGTDIHVDMMAGTGDAYRTYEHNGNGFGAYALFGLGGIFAHRGDDILVSRGALLHVITESERDVQIVKYGTHPAEFDDVLVSQHS